MQELKKQLKKNQCVFWTTTTMSPTRSVRICKGKLLKFTPSQEIEQTSCDYEYKPKWFGLFGTKRIETQKSVIVVMPAKYFVEDGEIIHELDRVFPSRQALINSL